MNSQALNSKKKSFLFMWPHWVFVTLYPSERLEFLIFERLFKKGLTDFFFLNASSRSLFLSLNHLVWIAQHIQMPLYVEYQWLAYYRCAYIDLWPCLEALAWVSVCVCFPKIGVLVHSLVKNRGPSMCVYKNAFDFMGAWLPTTGHLL